MHCYKFIRNASIVCLSLLLSFSYMSFADSAAAWKAYQEGRNPFLEVGVLVVGAVVFFVALGFIHKLVEKKKTLKRKQRKKYPKE